MKQTEQLTSLKGTSLKEDVPILKLLLISHALAPTRTIQRLNSCKPTLLQLYIL